MTIWLQILIASLLATGGNNKTYFEVVPATDSTSYIVWGNQDFERQTTKTYPSSPTDQRISIKAENEHYLALQYWTGSDSHVLLILPLDETSKEKVYWNDLALDLESEIIVYESALKHEVLVAENFRTMQKQSFGSDWKPCSSAFPHYCIEGVVIKGKILLLTWITPNRFDVNAASQRKELKLII